MTDTSASPSASPGSTGASPRRSWVPHIPAPLQRLFDAVPLVTYPPNELPYRSPGATDLPTLHVFISEQDAARGLPSFNPSCLKWQAFLRIAGVQFHLRPSTNHASPTGALPFLQPPIPSISSSSSSSSNNPSQKTTTPPPTSSQRLEPRALLPIPSSRLAAYASQHGALPPTSITSEASTPQLQSQARRRQAYQALLDGPVRGAWLYSLYLSPANEGVLRRWYIDPVSSSAAVRDATLRQLRRAVRAELASSTTTTTGTTTKEKGWTLSGNVGDVLSWAMGGKTVVDPVRIYADAARALEALETLLYREGKDEDTAEAGLWFFDSPHPTLFDAAVFSYVYLILRGGGAGGEGGKPWADDSLRQILVTKCSRLVGHTQRILDGYWSDGQGQGQAQVGQEDWVELS
ncbi:hypothetical protein VPNG_05452 [Cytospora leucostoma]|uniref:Thioredoxin-like fold domain-containing protein n=1 Tax=Cytospora leucostoma TaxID=1230097 RepID=A0A423XBI0_9PEZI|nr:hypothetical protein VPNG_05452 [Cytospora leucostoma]